MSPLLDPSWDFETGVETAWGRIEADILRTDCTLEPDLGRALGAEVRVKWENRQRTGSFKLRGALAKIRSLPPARRRAGLVTASTGNHGLAMAWAAARDGLPLVLFLPATVAAHKWAKLKMFPVEIEIRGYRLCLRVAQLDALRVELDDGREASAASERRG